MAPAAGLPFGDPATAYDAMVIPRVKGKRREMRRLLAKRSVEVLASYRRGDPVREGCVLGRDGGLGLAGGCPSSGFEGGREEEKEKEKDYD